MFGRCALRLHQCIHSARKRFFHGAALAFGLTRLISTVLFGVKPSDPLTYAAVALGLAVIALIACYIPARRAIKVDPNVALRYG